MKYIEWIKFTLKLEMYYIVLKVMVALHKFTALNKFGSTRRVKNGREHLSQTGVLLCLEETSLVGVQFWSRTHSHIRLWSRSRHDTIICFKER